MCIRDSLYAEHEFNASTFTARVIAGTGSDMFSAITGAIGALRGPKHGGANEVAFDVQKRYETPDEAEADIRRRVEAKEVIIGFGHPVYTVSDPRNKVCLLYTSFHFEGGHAQDVAGFVAQQVQRHPFDEELGAGGNVALVQGCLLYTSGSRRCGAGRTGRRTRRR